MAGISHRARINTDVNVGCLCRKAGIFLIFSVNPSTPPTPPTQHKCTQIWCSSWPAPHSSGAFRSKMVILALSSTSGVCFFPARRSAVGSRSWHLRAGGGRIAEQHCLGRSYHLFMSSFCTYSVSCQRELENRWRDNMVSTIHREAGFGFLFDLIVGKKKKRVHFFKYFTLTSHHSHRLEHFCIK